MERRRIVEGDGFCEDEGAVLGLFRIVIIAVVMGGAEVDAGAALQ